VFTILCWKLVAAVGDLVRLLDGSEAAQLNMKVEIAREVATGVPTEQMRE
jgi:hypothetical protein